MSNLAPKPGEIECIIFLSIQGKSGKMIGAHLNRKESWVRNVKMTQAYKIRKEEVVEHLRKYLWPGYPV